MNLGLALLLRGDLEEGWPEYEWRWRLQGCLQTDLCATTVADGARPGGATILLYWEQGTLRHAAVHSLCSPGEATWWHRPGRRPACLGAAVTPLVLDRSTFLLQAPPCPLSTSKYLCLSLPGVLHTTLATLPAMVPYLKPILPWSSVGYRSSLVLTGISGLELTGRGVPNTKETDIVPFLAPLRAVVGPFAGVKLFSLQKGVGD